MMRTVFTQVAFVGRTCLQSNNRPLYCQARVNFQYFPPRRSLISVARLLVNSASNSLKYYNNNGLLRNVLRKRCTGPGPAKTGSTPSAGGSTGTANPPEKLSLYGKFKAMYKDYWYVMLPVHLVTSAGWFGGFYKIASSGVDVGHYLRKLGINESLVKHITESGMGNIAVAWALYKIATPIRYMVTLGGTTISINQLRNMGYIKPAKVLMAKGRDKIQSIKHNLPKK